MKEDRKVGQGEIIILPNKRRHTKKQGGIIIPPNKRPHGNMGRNYNPTQ